jgi:cyclopropane fatty-acyl-phospholipid synthase-like methyltransferase
MGLITDGKFGGYPHGRGTWEPALWQWAVKHYAPKSMADIGCGKGWAVKFFSDVGVVARGYDGSHAAINYFYSHIQKYNPKNQKDQGMLLHHDFETGSISQRYDLIWSAEFVEHVDEKFVPNLVHSMTPNKALFLLHGLPGQQGHHHVNCQPSEYWLDKFAAVGLHYDEKTTMESRKLSRFKHRGWGAKGLILTP